MFINPQQAIDSGWITFLDGTDIDVLVQPNAIDFTLDRLYKLKDDSSFYLHEEFKIHRGTVEVEPQTITREMIVDEYFKLDAHSCYDAMSDIYVSVPEGVAAFLIVRSSLNRNGLFITSGLYDSGFKGNIGFFIHNNASSPAYLQEGVRVGQIIFVKSDSHGVYSGSYNTQPGQFWNDRSHSLPTAYN